MHPDVDFKIVIIIIIILDSNLDIDRSIPMKTSPQSRSIMISIKNMKKTKKTKKMKKTKKTKKTKTKKKTMMTTTTTTKKLFPSLHRENQSLV